MTPAPEDDSDSAPAPSSTAAESDTDTGSPATEDSEETALASSRLHITNDDLVPTEAEVVVSADELASARRVRVGLEDLAPPVSVDISELSGRPEAPASFADELRSARSTRRILAAVAAGILALALLTPFLWSAVTDTEQDSDSPAVVALRERIGFGIRALSLDFDEAPD